ncbi:MAG: hypothetical protein ACAI38_11640 [Myxococcota bacterium]
MVNLIALLALGATNGPVLSNAEMRGKGAAILSRDIENVKTMRQRVVGVLPETVVRDSVVLGLDENLPSIPLRKIARDVPIMIQHAQISGHGTDTTVFMGYGPEDDDDYDATAAGAKLFYAAGTNPAGIKLNLTRKFAQLCDLVVTLEGTKRGGQPLYHGVQVTRLIPGLLGIVAITIGHEAMHAAQYQTHPALDLDSHRNHIKDGQVSAEALEALRWARAYEQEAYVWEYSLAVAWKAEINTAAEALIELRQRDPQEFARNGRFEFLGEGRRNELVQHYMRDVVASAEASLKKKEFAFTGDMHLLVDSLFDVPAATNALIAANDEAVIVRGPKIQELREATAKAEKVCKEYFEQGEATDRMLDAHPFLKDVRPRLDREIERARGRLMGG